MTPSQLKEKYCTFNESQLRYLSDMHRKAAINSQREAAYIDRELKRRNREVRTEHEN
jgi:hypothetical protein